MARSSDKQIDSAAPASSLAGLGQDLARGAATTSETTASKKLEKLAHEFCAEGKRQGMDAVSLLVTLKKIWADSPEVARIGGKRTRDELLAKVVSACINEYYADQ